MSLVVGVLKTLSAAVASSASATPTIPMTEYVPAVSPDIVTVPPSAAPFSTIMNAVGLVCRGAAGDQAHTTIWLTVFPASLGLGSVVKENSIVPLPPVAAAPTQPEDGCGWT